MARIRYLVDNDPWRSMYLAIIAENIAFGKFYRKFRELWGRLSSFAFEEEYDESTAIRAIDTHPILGGNKVLLFEDGAAGYQYTMAFCKLIGADYDELYAHKGDVNHFYVSLDAAAVRDDFSDTAVITAAMSNLRSAIDVWGIDRVDITLVLDTEYESGADATWDLARIRSEGVVHIDHDSGVFDAAAQAKGLRPVIGIYGLPTPSYPDGEPLVSAIVASDPYLVRTLMIFLQYTGYMDPVFNQIDVTAAALPDRVYDDGLTIHTYAQFQYVLSFTFGSSIDENDVVTDLIDWSYLGGNAFADAFAAGYAESAAWIDAHHVCYTSGPKKTPYGQYCYLDAPGTYAVIGTAAVITFLTSYSYNSELFYLENKDYFYVNRQKAYLLIEGMDSVSSREFAQAILSVMQLGAEEKNDGWLGGSWLGKFLEGIFVVFVIVGSLVVAIVTGNPLALVVGMSLLYVGARYTNMSITNQRFAAQGIRLLSIVSAAWGVYAIYNKVYEYAVDEAINEAVNEALSQGASQTAARAVGYAAGQSIGFAEVVLNIGVVDAIRLATSLYGAFNLLSPPEELPTEEEPEAPEEDTSVYNISSSYDLYDDLYDAY